jgi:uncharacterized protein YbjT (DUF2867 family)
MSREPGTLPGRAPGTELIKGDLLDKQSLLPAMDGVVTAFYLAHSMNGEPGFVERERQAARNFAEVARESGVKRIIYLGALVQGEDLSPHMQSRVETGHILRSTGVPVIEFRASIIIGSGSASFELIRSLVEKLPVMVTPRWVSTASQPVAIEDVIDYLTEALSLPDGGSKIVEIGGADVTSYLGIMEIYARLRGLRRFFIRVPLLSLSLSSRWLTLFTPLYAPVGRQLIESVRNRSIVEDPGSGGLFSVKPMGIERAIRRAVANEDMAIPRSRWSDARGCPVIKTVPDGRLLRNEQTIEVPLAAEQAFAPIRRIGGANGWYFSNILWRLRGLADLVLGGVGMRRRRPNPEVPVPGGTLDFWRVESYQPARSLRLRAEMKVPGQAWLEFLAEPRCSKTLVRQIASFSPSGVLGYLYWYLLWPVHEVMFRGMLRRIAGTAVLGEKEPAG